MSGSDDRLTIEEWLDRYIDYLAGATPKVPSLIDLDANDRPEARRMAATVSELWGRNASPLTTGPSVVAAALGFDQIDNDVSIAGPRLKSARRSAGFTVSALSRELCALGWSVTAAELGEFETGKRLDVPGSSIPLLVALLDLDATQLIQGSTVPVDGLLAVDRVRAVIKATSERLSLTLDEVTLYLRPRLAAAQYRKRDSQEDDLVEIVEAILDGME